MSSPMEIAVCHDQKEMLRILTEYKEIPDDVKLVQLSMLMSSARTAIECKEEHLHFKGEFQEILSSLTSVEMVKHNVVIFST